MKKQLTRSKKAEQEVAGVCGGIADYLETDPAIVRIVFVLTAFFSFGVMLYVACWVSMPSHPEDRKA